MWVSQGCRGKFLCSGTELQCGKSQRSLYNCTCLWEGWDTFTWSTDAKTVKALDKVAVDDRTKKSRSQWLAAIISMDINGARFQAASSSASAMGFEVRHIQPAIPSQYRSRNDMLHDLFGAKENQPIMIAMTAYEIALLLSHKKALRAIALSSYSWGAVLEDDAYMHEALHPSQGARLLEAAVAAADAAPARPTPPLLYMGGCKPTCEADVVFGRDQAALAGGLPESLLRVGRCQAFCTHAYALSRTHASTFFDDVFGCRNGTLGCGAECELYPCYMDWAMHRYFRRTGEAWVVGGGLHSQWVDNHRGMFIQNRSAALGNKFKRSGLAKNFRWRNSSALVEEQGCAKQSEVGNSSIRATRLRKLLITMDWSGRLGNLMFEVAMVVSMVERLKKIVPEVEAVTFGLPSSHTVPAREMFEQFHTLNRMVRRERSASSTSGLDEIEGKTGFEQVYENQLAGCQACKLEIQETFANKYDPGLLRKLEAWVKSPPQGCVLGLVKFQGYFQSYLYFDGVAAEMLRSSVFDVGATAKAEVDGILTSIRSQLPPMPRHGKGKGMGKGLGSLGSGTSSNAMRRSDGMLGLGSAEMGHGGNLSGWKFVGVQIRLGDKVRSEFYSSLYAATSWEYYRNAMHTLSTRLRELGASGVAFIVTAGGSLGSNAVDIANARANLSFSTDGRGHRVFFSTADSPYVDLALLRRCDALVVGPSTFGWWAAYLGKQGKSMVVAPRYVINPKLPRRHALVVGFRRTDYYPRNWELLSNDGKPPPPPRPTRGHHREHVQAASPPLLSPPPPKPADPCDDTSKARKGSGSQHLCFLRFVGSCRSFSRPEYHDWFSPFSPNTAAAATTRLVQLCVQRQRGWQASCGPNAIVEMRFCHQESHE